MTGASPPADGDPQAPDGAPPSADGAPPPARGGSQPTDDPWAAARKRARVEVAGALAAGERSCPACGARRPAATRRCRECGAELVSRRGSARPPRRRLLSAAAVALALTVAIGGFVARSREDAAGERRAAEQRQAAIERAERTRLLRESRPRTRRLSFLAGGDALRARRRAISVLEAAITADARRRAEVGRLDGPILETRCAPVPRTATRAALETDPAATRLPYSCVALKRRFALPPEGGRRREGLFGHPYRAVIDLARRRASWCRVFPPAGEGGRSLAIVALDPACRARPARHDAARPAPEGSR